MINLDSLFDAFGGPTAVGKAIGVPRTHAATMKARGSIPPEYWPALIEAAKRNGIKGVNAEMLMNIAARRAGAAA